MKVSVTFSYLTHVFSYSDFWSVFRIVDVVFLVQCGDVIIGAQKYK